MLTSHPAIGQRRDLRLVRLCGALEQSGLLPEGFALSIGFLSSNVHRAV